MNEYLGLICVRGGSKGVPGKNVRLLAGKPLLHYAVETALRIPVISRLIVSTDSSEIAHEAEIVGAEVPFLRPASLAEDNSPEWLVWRHTLDYVMQHDGQFYDGLVVLPAVAPLRADEDVLACLKLYEEKDTDIVITVTDADRSPYFNMVQKDDAGYVQLVIPPSSTINRRQDAPVVYDMATVAYVARPQFVMENDTLFGGKVRSVHIPKERALDIDTEFDFKLAELLIREQKSRGI